MNTAVYDKKIIFFTLQIYENQNKSSENMTKFNKIKYK